MILTMVCEEIVAPVMVSISPGLPLPAPGLTGISGVCGSAKNWSTLSSRRPDRPGALDIRQTSLNSD